MNKCFPANELFLNPDKTNVITFITKKLSTIFIKHWIKAIPVAGREGP
jgi:hypothetical protein